MDEKSIRYVNCFSVDLIKSFERVKIHGVYEQYMRRTRTIRDRKINTKTMTQVDGKLLDDWYMY